MCNNALLNYSTHLLLQSWQSELAWFQCRLSFFCSQVINLLLVVTDHFMICADYKHVCTVCTVQLYILWLRLVRMFSRCIRTIAALTWSIWRSPKLSLNRLYISCSLVAKLKINQFIVNTLKLKVYQYLHRKISESFWPPHFCLP